jgi:UTP--glucose-1-phosphate uridylyltransferase
VAMGRDAVADRPFLCLLSDNIAYPNTNPSTEMISTFVGSSVLGLREIPDAMLDSYGVAVLASDQHTVAQTIEKPGRDSPSNLGLVGRYIFTSGIFDLLETSETGHGGEIQLTDSIDALCQSGVVTGCVLEQGLLDTGTPANLLEAITTLGWHSDTYGERYRLFVQDLAR